MEEDRQGLLALRQQLIAGKLPLWPPPPTTTTRVVLVSDLPSSGRNLEAVPTPNPLEDVTLWSTWGRGIGQSSSSSFFSASPGSAAACVPFGGLDMESGGDCNNLVVDAIDADGSGGGGRSRWPRHETLTLLEIRSRLDHNFKETNTQKRSLWDEVSRIMMEEYGYQRSGKKCREKFENLFKYYRKTREGKHRRQDGKHYRFFPQLEALFGDLNPQATRSKTNVWTASPIHDQTTKLQDMKLQKSLSMSSSSKCDAYECNPLLQIKSKYEEQCSGVGKNKKKWEEDMEDFVGSYMMRLEEAQEACMEKMLKVIEDREEETMVRQEEQREEERARWDREYEFWANERAWIEAQDTALMEAFQSLASKEEPRLPLRKETLNKEGPLDGYQGGVVELDHISNFSKFHENGYLAEGSL